MTENQNKVVQAAGKVLGKQFNDYKTSYDPTLLVSVERELNRIDYNISNNDFVGYDIWHAYEVSFLSEKGLPTTAVGKICIPSDSKYFIESKSMKLYFYSFNMERYGQTREEGIRIIEETASRDLSAATGGEVKVKLFLKEDNIESFPEAQPIEDLININNIEFKVFQEDETLIEVTNEPGEAFVYIGNVRSNCRVTHQPDFSRMILKYKSSTKKLNLESLQKFVVSFRNENHFHEEVCEQMFKMLSDKLEAEELMIGMLYTRRGGIDICPIRANKADLLEEKLIDINILTRKTINQ